MALLDIVPNLSGILQTLAPLADQAGAALGVSPATVLGQWALESGNGLASNAVGTNNYAGIMIPGTQTLQSFSSPADFEAAYVNVMQHYPDALNTGSDVNAFVNGLTENPSHMYTTTPASTYANSLSARMASLGLPSALASGGTAAGVAATGSGDSSGSAVSTAQSAQGAVAGLSGIFTWIYNNPLSFFVLIIVALATVGIIISTVWNSGKAVASHV